MKGIICKTCVEMGISEEEDKEWHRKHEISEKMQVKMGQKQVNPFAVGGGFLDYCIKQGWLIQEGNGRNAKYYVTEVGEEEIRKFGIEI